MDLQLLRHRRLLATAVTAAAVIVSGPAAGGSASIGRPDFALAAVPATQTVVPGAGASYKISLIRRNGFIGQVKVAVTSVPPGVTATLRVQSATLTAWILTLTTSRMLHPYCCYTVKVTGTSGALVHTTSVTLDVIGPDFKLSVSPSSQSVTDGSRTTYIVTLTRLNGFVGSPVLRVGGLPPDVTSVFRPSSLQTTAKLIITTSASTPPATYHLVISAALGSVRRSALGTLVVPAPVVTQYPLPTPGVNPRGIVTGPDGALWFTEYQGTSIGRITTSGVVQEFPITSGDPLFSSHIAVGPDGALWFTRHEVGWNIGRITTKGVVSEYVAPTYSGLDGITTGPDGDAGQALWFTEWDANQIGVLTLGGGFREFGPVAASPSEITQGPDGAMWFATLGGKIGRITATGTLVQYPLPGFSTGSAFSITTGPDGALWIADYGDSAIVRMATSGQLEVFPLPDGGDPQGITTGPDGALWFTVAGRDEIGRITTQGTLTEYPYTAVAGPGNVGGAFITTGPDNALWFTEASAIGRITLP